MQMLWAAMLWKAAAHPASMTCNYACLGGYSEGSSFGFMGIASVGATTGDTCKITHDVPVAGYTPGASYTVTVTSLIPKLSQKLASSAGTFASSGVSDVNTKVTSHSHSWTAPGVGGGSTSFRALCGAGGSIDEMWYAAPVTVTGGAGSVATTTTTAAATTVAGSATGLELSSGLALKADVAGSTISVEVTYTSDTWVGIGFPSTSALSMTGSGAGTDTFICSSGAVKRYWMTTYSVPSGGVDVAGSSCSFVSGVTTMSFSRAVAASGSQEVEVTPGTAQMVIWAHGISAGATTLAYHGSGGRGGLMVDFATLEGTGASKSAGAVLFLHLILMALAWTVLLPWGVAIAKFTKLADHAAPGKWFRWHRKLQVSGVLLQLIGFVMAVWHVSENGIHFSSPHHFVGLVVFVLAMFQPVNAALRKCVDHPVPGQKKSTGRLIFEIVHKGSGYLAVVLGIANCWLGVALLLNQNYGAAEIAVAAALCGLGTASVLIYVVMSLIDKNNCISRGLVVETKTVQTMEVKEPYQETNVPGEVTA
ncbi:unnamed protein product [Effrenium voratum]|nr:unnamed protein product [Effrenium voratum]